MDVGPVVDHCVHRAQVAAEPAHVRQPRPVATQPLAVADPEVIQELGLPLDVAPRVGAHVRRVGALEIRVGVDLAVERTEPAPGAVVGQADLVDGDQMRRLLRIEEGEPGRHLPADRVSDDGGLGDADVLHEPGRVRRVQAHAVREDRLG